MTVTQTQLDAAERAVLRAAKAWADNYDGESLNPLQNAIYETAYALMQLERAK